MKKFLAGALLFGALMLTTGSVFACDKDCDCGCQQGEKCTCKKECAKGCDKDCDCDCHKGEKCNCKEDCKCREEGKCECDKDCDCNKSAKKSIKFSPSKKEDKIKCNCDK